MTENGVFVGTSGWTYDDWSGLFYPEEVGGAERLSFYARHFNTVEVNASFYRVPTRQMIESWNRRLGDEFHLVLKGNRTITHLKKLDNCLEALERFLAGACQLRRLKVILWQLPPFLHKDVGRLERFLALLPQHIRHAVEFRHESWWDEDVVQALSRGRAAFVAVSHPNLPDTVYATTDFLYVRFHGLGRELYRYNYSTEELSHWRENLEPHLPGRTLYAFFNNDYDANAIHNARQFREVLMPF